jgi:hypothetical protein
MSKADICFGYYDAGLCQDCQWKEPCRSVAKRHPIQPVIDSMAYNELLKAMQYAKNKHPEYPINPAEALCIITEELGELAQAINDKESKDRQIEEAAHVAVTAIRFIEQAVK